MKSSNLKYKNLFTAIIVMTIAVIFILMLIKGITFKLVWKTAVDTGIVFTVVGFFWWTFNKYWWSCRFAKFLYLSRNPDVRGRWEGTIQRDDDSESYPFVIEISQTLTHIYCKTFSKKEFFSESSYAWFTTDEHESYYKLHYEWEGAGEQLEGLTDGKFSGMTILDVINGDTKELNGEYYTQRKTKGKLKLKFAGKKLKNKF